MPNIPSAFSALRGFTPAVAALMVLAGSCSAMAQSGRNDAYRPPAEPDYDVPAGQGGTRFGGQTYGQQPPQGNGGGDQGYAGSPAGGYGQSQGGTYAQGGTYGQGGGYGQNTYGQPQTYGNQAAPPPYQQPPAYPPSQDGRSYANNNGGYGYGGPRADDSYRGPPRNDGYGAPYSPPPAAEEAPPRYENSNPNSPTRGYYSQGEIVDKGRGFFGAVSQGLASAIEYTYQQAGRPNGYILGEDGGGAFFAGLRYGEGMLYTKDAGDQKVFWQGPSLGYDVGGEGSKVMVLVYNLSDPGEVFHRFGGVEGSAYLVGGVSVQFQKHEDVTMAVIRSGVGLRLGANVGYLKYTRSPTWNPF